MDKKKRSRIAFILFILGLLWLLYIKWHYEQQRPQDFQPRKPKFDKIAVAAQPTLGGIFYPFPSPYGRQACPLLITHTNIEDCLTKLLIQAQKFIWVISLKRCKRTRPVLLGGFGRENNKSKTPTLCGWAANATGIVHIAGADELVTIAWVCGKS